MGDEQKAEPQSQSIVERLARPNILALNPYRCARDDYDRGILLDANENALGPTSVPTSCLPDDNSMVLERYPCPYQIPLKTLYSKYRGCGLAPSNIFVGVGSDEAIDLLMRIFCTPGKDTILTTPPTYGMYKVCAAVNDVRILAVPLSPDFDLRMEPMLEAVEESTKLLFICSPGNPTAKAIPLKDVERICSSNLYNGIVVVDEAYVDFSKKGSAVELISKYENVVVLQTLSKAFGLAGIRMGFAIGNPEIIQLMNNVKAPYNINKLSSDVAVNALKNIPTLETNIGILLKEREVLMTKLNALEFVTKVYPSDANFVLFRMKQLAQELYVTMANRGIVTRFRGNEIHCEECLRVTVGTPEENVKFWGMLVDTYAELSR